MKKRLKYQIIVAVILAQIGFGYSNEINLKSSSFVPVGNDIYSFLDNCASRGLIPVSATTLKPLSRIEISRYILDIYRNQHSLNDRVLHDELEYYVGEFALDIERIIERKSNADMNVDVISGVNSPHWHLGSLQTEYFSFIFDPIITARWDIAEEKTVFRRATGIQFRGHVQNKIGFSFRFVDHVEKGNSPYRHRSNLLEDRWGYVGPLLGGSETYYDLTEAYLTFQTGLLEIAFGKDRLAWGPGEEHLLIGGSAPSINHLRFRFDIGENCRLLYVIGKLTPWKTPGDSLYTNIEGWTRLIPAEKWLAAHRFEYFYQDFLTIGISEAIVWGDRGLDIAYLNPLNFLFSAEHDGGDIDNVLLSGDIELRLWDWGLGYGSLLIDDLKTSTLGEGSPGNKFGYTAGLKFYNLGISGLETSLDYTRIDPFVYSHFFPVNRFTTWTSSMGSSLKPNSDRIRWRLKYKPKRNLAINVRIDTNRHGTVGGEISETIPRDPNKWTGTAYLLDGERTSWVEVETAVAYEAYPGLVFESGIIDGNVSTTLPDRYFLGFSYRF
ncbi:MAG: hypothetical protein HN356_00100 [Calditrichaeota bacterium]|nr:hypothetical protein [Calditrichota bacterium]MBT7618993.1 hypothetical protein [Calditrichota bacterium]